MKNSKCIKQLRTIIEESAEQIRYSLDLFIILVYLL